MEENDIDDAGLRNLFAHHPPTGDQAARYQTIRAACLECARVIIATAPVSAMRRRAIEHLHETMCLANGSIATN